MYIPTRRQSKLVLTLLFTSLMLGPVTSVLPGLLQEAQAADPPGLPSNIELSLLAAGERSAVLAPTTGNDTTTHNGSEWYYRLDYSMGFALGGSSIFLSGSDINDSDGEYRLSWELAEFEAGDQMVEGYRLGNETHLYDEWYSRYIYHADSLPEYYPTGPQLDIDSEDLTGWELCYSGFYSDIVALNDLWSDCDGDYLLFAGAPTPELPIIDVCVIYTVLFDTPGGTQNNSPKVFPESVLGLKLYNWGNPESEYRLSWHLEDGWMNGGWRVGEINELNDSSAYWRYIYHADSLPAYFPSGPQLNVDVDDLTGWTECFGAPYHDEHLLEEIWDDCDGNYLLLAGTEGEAPESIKLLAAGERQYVLAPTTNNNTTSHNGSQWYYRLDYSMGFAGHNHTIQLDTADLLGTNYSSGDSLKGLDWSHFRVFISNCLVIDCGAPDDPITDPGSWDSGTVVTNGSFSVPAEAEGRYLAIMSAEDESPFTAHDLSYIIIVVSNPPQDYFVHDCADLQAIMTDHLLDNIYLEGPIDCSDPEFTEDEGFLPIGYPDQRFEGNFYGQGNTISNLTIDRGDWNYVGLFGVVEEGSVIKDFNLVNVDITGNTCTGGVVGYLSGTMQNVHVSGSVYGYTNVGGAVGCHQEALGTGSSSVLLYTWDGEEYDFMHDIGRGMPRNLTGEDYVQIDSNKLVPIGDKYSMKMTQEYNEIAYYDEAKLITFDHAPGYNVVVSNIRDGAENEFRTISDNPSHPLLSCTDMYGNDCLDDLANDDDKWSFKHKSNLNYWEMDFGDLSGAEQTKLVIRGAIDYTLEAPQSLRLVQVRNAEGNWVNAYSSSEIASLGGSPRLLAIDLTGKFQSDNYEVRLGFDRTRMNYVSMDTSAAQEFEMTELYPTKANLGFRGYTEVDREFYWDHNYNVVYSTPQEPFANQTGWFTKYGNVAPLLQDTNDQYVIMHHGDHIDMEFDAVPVAEGKERSFMFYNWITYKHAKSGELGRTVEPLPFVGMSAYPYSGEESYPLTAENIAYLREWNTRFIDGKVVGGGGSTIIDSSANVETWGYSATGGLVGYNTKQIMGSSASGHVEGTWVVGGFVGSNDGEIERSYATGNVDGWGQIGGFAGYSEWDIEQSFATGEVEGAWEVGGFIGYNDGWIYNSFARGTATGGSSLGGFVGFNTGSVERTYATGMVIPIDSPENNVGTLAGYDDGYLYNVFWDIETQDAITVPCGNWDCTEGVYGKNTAQMKTEATFTTDNDESWDFEEVWAIDLTMDINDGYPYLIGTLSDSDQDGIENSVENSGPNGGDANNDGDLDSDQHNVASFVNSVTGHYTVLEVPEQCQILSVGIISESDAEAQDPDFHYPAGLMDFSIDCDIQGFEALVKVFNYGVDQDISYLLKKYDPEAGTYINISGATVQHTTIGGQAVTIASYTIVDGGPLDLDGAENGTIVDPVGLGYSAIGPSNTGFGGMSK